jgi:hypothetical protein
MVNTPVGMVPGWWMASATYNTMRLINGNSDQPNDSVYQWQIPIHG